MHAPICSKHPLNALPGGQRLFLHFDNEIQHGEPLPICSTLFAQRGSHQVPIREALLEAVWQRNDGVHSAPMPDSRLVWIPEAKSCHPCIQIQGQTICLTFFTSVVSCIGQHPHLKPRDRLEFFVS